MVNHYRDPLMNEVNRHRVDFRIKQRHFAPSFIVATVCSNKWNLICLLWSVLLIQGFSQVFSVVAELPEVLDESSGIECGGQNSFWTFNDSGNEPSLFLIDTSGTILRKVDIQNAWNRDWEDITRDDQGHIYIGNIGNNSNKNTDLCIFKIPDPDSIRTNSIHAEIIRFRYEDQNDYPPPDDVRYFDCEALWWSEGNLYMATKNRTEPFDGITWLYRLPDAPGDYIAKKIGHFNTGGDEMVAFWITAGDLSPDGSKLTLLSSDKLWVFYDFNGDDFFSGKNTRIELPTNTQKEAICFIDENTLYLTDEAWNRNIGRKLYKLVIHSLDPPLQTAKLGEK